jgi:putative NIF3 family GTP cyclohydrolase 1 type 2
MNSKDISRRKFLLMSGGSAASLGAGILAPSFIHCEKKAITAGELMDLIKKNLHVPWKQVTVDTMKGAGNPDMVVTGITTTFMATLDVLQKSIKKQNNFILAHEPTFWTNLDLGEGLTGDPLYLYKQEFIKSNRLFVHRFHDHWHARRPDGIFEGWNQVMGWDKYKFDETLQVYLLPVEISLYEYAKELKRRLKSDSVRVIGNPQMMVKTVNRGSNKVPDTGTPFADLTITYEPDRENSNVEWERDIVSTNQQKAFIIVSHNRLEEFGMDNCASWLRGFIPELPIEFIPSGDPFWRTWE